MVYVECASMFNQCLCVIPRPIKQTSLQFQSFILTYKACFCAKLPDVSMEKAKNELILAILNKNRTQLHSVKPFTISKQPILYRIE